MVCFSLNLICDRMSLKLYVNKILIGILRTNVYGDGSLFTNEIVQSSTNFFLSFES